MKATLPTIESMKLVAEEDHIDFLPKMLQNRPSLIMLFENIVFKNAHQLCKEYDGGSWEFVELENGAFFIYPDFDGVKQCSCDTNWAEGQLDGRVLGVICTMLALNQLIWMLYEKDLKSAKIANELYYQLRDWVYRDETGDAIRAVSDDTTASNFTKAVYKFLD